MHFAAGTLCLQVLYLYVILLLNEVFPEIKTEILMKNISSNPVHITLICLNLPFNSKDVFALPALRKPDIFLHPRDQGPHK